MPSRKTATHLGSFLDWNSAAFPASFTTIFLTDSLDSAESRESQRWAETSLRLSPLRYRDWTAASRSAVERW